MASNASAPANNAEVFIYMGEEGPSVPNDVVRVRVHPSVTRIPDMVFINRIYLEEVELCEGLLEIGSHAFYRCCLMKRIVIPSTMSLIGIGAFRDCSRLEEIEFICGALTEIGNHAFLNCRSLTYFTTIENQPSSGTQLIYRHLPDSIQSIGQEAFEDTKLPTFRMPSHITSVPHNMVHRCNSTFSLELPGSTMEVSLELFVCDSLRNVAIPLDYVTAGTCYDSQLGFDLKHVFGPGTDVTLNALKHRFDGLPIHKMIYYQSYNSATVQDLNKATNRRSAQRRTLRAKLDPTGKQQDCLGMTPLHIMACSTVQDFELYPVMIEKYPRNLITEDKWGALPVLYTVWGGAPDQIVQFMLKSHQTLFPDHELNWALMMETLGAAGAPPGIIKKLLELQQAFYPDQTIDWENVMKRILDVIAERDGGYVRALKTFQCLVECSITERLSAIGVKQWRTDITKDCVHDSLNFSAEAVLAKIYSKVAYYEIEYHKLRESTSILELALWNAHMKACRSPEKKRRRKKMKLDTSRFRSDCRVSCKAGAVISNVLSYLLPERS